MHIGMHDFSKQWKSGRSLDDVLSVFYHLSFSHHMLKFVTVSNAFGYNGFCLWNVYCQYFRKHPSFPLSIHPDTVNASSI